MCFLGFFLFFFLLIGTSSSVFVIIFSLTDDCYPLLLTFSVCYYIKAGGRKTPLTSKDSVDVYASSRILFSVFFFSPPLCLGVVRASNIFPILSAILLLMGGVCIAASRFYKSKRNIILGAGILFVAAGKNIGSDSAFVCWRVYANVRAGLDMPKVVLWNVWKGLFMCTIMPFLLKVIFKAASCKIHLFRLQVKKKKSYAQN